MLHHITWHQYFTAVFLIAVVYYLWVIFRCYQPELKKLSSRFSADRNRQALQELQYQEPEPITANEMTGMPPSQETAAGERPETIYPAGTEALAGQLRTVIQTAAGQPYAPAALTPQLKNILLSFPEIAASPYRETINEFIVEECEKNGTALLTEDEVDQWWRA